MLLGSEHQDRYAQMEEDVNFRTTDFWFMRSPEAPQDDELNHVVGFLLQEFMKVGPFGSHFVKEHPGKWNSQFYGVPLQHLFVHPSTDGFDALAFVASNPASSVLMKGCFDYLRQLGNRVQFSQLGLSVMAVQRARSTGGEQIVVSIDCLTNLNPLSIYEHPSNGRLLMAMQGEEVPDVCALTLIGKRQSIVGNIHDVYMDATTLYNELEMDEIEEATLIEELFELYKG